MRVITSRVGALSGEDRRVGWLAWRSPQIDAWYSAGNTTVRGRTEALIDSPVPRANLNLMHGP